MYLNPTTKVSKKNPHYHELHFFSPQIFDIDPNAMLEIIVINVDDEFSPTPKTHKKVVTDVDHKFQEIQAIKMSRAKPIFNEVGMVFIMKCCVCTGIVDS
jgi:hypothetical protein